MSGAEHRATHPIAHHSTAVVGWGWRTGRGWSRWWSSDRLLRTEDPLAQQDEPQRGGEQVGENEGGGLDQSRWRPAHGGEQREGPAGETEAESEDHEPLAVLTGAARSAHAEGPAAVRRGVADRGREQRDEVRRLRPHDGTREYEQQEVRERGERADGGEA